MLRARSTPVDIFLSVFLPELLGKVLGRTVDVVTPEFPLKKSTSNQSTNVDYLLFGHDRDGDGDSWLFFELKTDDSSFNYEQAQRYGRAIERGMPALIADVHTIRDNSKQRQKYNTLLERLAPYPR